MPLLLGCYITKRYTQAVQIMFGFIISLGIQCNVGVAIVKMMSNTTNEEGDVMDMAEFTFCVKSFVINSQRFFFRFCSVQTLMIRFSSKEFFW